MKLPLTLAMILMLPILAVAQPQPAPPSCEENLAAFRLFGDQVNSARAQVELDRAALINRLRTVEAELAALKAKATKTEGKKEK